MTTTFTPTKTERILLARNSSRAASAQVTGGTVTRSGTTATFNKTSHGFSTSDVLFIQGNSIDVYNGVFTITVVDANNFTYVIKVDPGANPAASVATADKCVVSSLLDLSTKLGAIVSGLLQNTSTGPALAAQVWMGLATANFEYDYFWSQVINGDTTANVMTPWRVRLDQATMFVKFIIFGNTSQPVDCTIYAQELTNIVGN